MTSGRSLSRPLKQTIVLIVLTTLLFSLLLNACGSDGQHRQDAQQNKAALDSLIAHAQDIGVPDTLLQPILSQESQLTTTSAPLVLFSDQPDQEYYANVAQRYHLLSLQIKGLEAQITQQLGYQAAIDMQSFESALSQRQNQGFVEADAFTDQLMQDQTMLAQARYPKDFLEVSSNARNATLALDLMGPANDQLTILHNAIQQLSDAGLDVSTQQQQELDDQTIFRNATDATSFQQLIDQIKAQVQAITTLSIQAIPFVGETKLNQFSATITQMKQYQIDTTDYQKQLATDRAALTSARSISDYLTVSARIDNDSEAARTVMLKEEATSLLQHYYQEVNTWGASHQYHDQFDGQSYRLDYEYDDTHGFGSELDSALSTARTAGDYQAVIDQINTFLLHLKAMEADASDSTPYTQPHNADLQLIQHYQLSGGSGSVIVVSLAEQALRFYQNGKLVKAFLITTGQYDRPTPPGLWQIFVRQSPMIFTSWEPKGSAFWYPNTDINYAMEYREDGYYFHDSWWRLDYGPGTNFPHHDSGGDEAFAGNGSHGCVNMPKDMAGWLYQNTGYDTPAIIY